MAFLCPSVLTQLAIGISIAVNIQCGLLGYDTVQSGWWVTNFTVNVVIH